MANIDIIGNILSPNAEKQLDALLAKVEKATSAIQNLNTLSSGSGSVGAVRGGRGGSKATFDAAIKAQEDLVKAEQKLQVAQQATTKTTVLTRTESQKLTAEQKLLAITLAENSTLYEKNRAQMELNTIQMQKMFNPALKQQSVAFRNLAAEQKKLQAENIRLARATGAMGTSMAGSYGAAFQMTQVMRELPNFAIDSRIGFMALSNNLPMLGEAFRQVRQEIVDTQGAAGATRKTFAFFAKSLLSFNTVLIVVSTLLIMLPQILELFTKINREMEAFVKAHNDVNNEVFNRMKTDMEAITNLAVQYHIANKLGEKETMRLLEEKAQKEYNINRDRLQSIKDNVNNWREAFKEYLEMAKVTYHNAARIKAGMDAEMENKKLVTEKNLIIKAAKDAEAQKLFNQPTRQMTLEGLKTGADRRVLAEREAEKRYIDGKVNIPKQLRDRWKEVNEELEKVNWELEVLESIKIKPEKMLPIEPKNTTGGRSPREKQGTDILIDKDIYTSRRALMEAIFVEEQRMQERTQEGHLNNLAIREEATMKYYNLQMELAELEQKDDRARLDSKFENDKQQIQSTHERNMKIVTNTKRKDELEEQFRQASLTLEANYNTELLKMNEEFGQARIQNQLAMEKALLAIKEASYKKDAEMIDRATAYQMNANAIAAASSAAELSKNTFGDKVQSIIGGKSIGNNLSKLEGARKSQVADEQTQSTSINLKLSNPNISPAERKRLLEEKAKIEADALRAGNEYRIAAEAETEKIISDLQIETAKSTIETMQQLLSNFFEWKEKQIDKELELNTKQNDERLAQFEDETKAGKHSQEELTQFKERNIAYQESLEAEAARKKAELDKKAFLLNQLFALGQIWIEYGVNMQKAGANPILQSWMLANAIAGTAIVAAQTIPAFAEGGIMENSGKAILGDGGKHELVVDPRGNFFVSDKTSGLYDLKAGSKIFPDINKLDIMEVLNLKKSLNNDSRNMSEITTLKNIEKAIKNQKRGNFYGMPLVRQLSNSDRYSNRKRSLMN